MSKPNCQDRVLCYWQWAAGSGKYFWYWVLGPEHCVWGQDKGRHNQIPNTANDPSTDQHHQMSTMAPNSTPAPTIIITTTMTTTTMTAQCSPCRHPVGGRCCCSLPSLHHHHASRLRAVVSNRFIVLLLLLSVLLLFSSPCNMTTPFFSSKSHNSLKNPKP